MSELDLIVRGGTVVEPGGVRVADVGIAGGRIVQVAEAIDEPACEAIDARGLTVLPGAVDTHVHFNEPGRTDWEGWATGTSALAAGGATVAAEMPFNALPPTTSAERFDEKRAAAEATAHVDLALWGGIVPGNVDELERLAERGAIGFKAFMCETGLEEFPGSDDLTLYEGMTRAAALGLPVAVHAENDAITRGLTARVRAEGRTGARDYVRSRPAIAEVEAIGRAILLAERTGCALHVVHVSTGRGVALVAEARARGVDVTCETCPHYLVLTEDDLERLGNVAKCGPPLRGAADQAALWEALADGRVPMVVSDHSPCPPELKAASALAAWGGISGCQSTLALLLDEGHLARGLPLPLLARLVAAFAARRFRLAGKGRIEPGADADLALVDLAAEHTLEAGDLLYRHRQSPYAGRRMRGRVVRTLVRGTTVFEDGAIVAPPHGRLVRPAGREVAAPAATVS